MAEEDEKQDEAKTSLEESGGDGAAKSKDLDAVYDIPVQVTTVIGKVNIPVSRLMTLEKGAVVELDKKVGEAVEIYVNRQLVARGDLVVSDGRLGVTMTEIIRGNLRKT
jgi:flagellar motor switch protein FliN/FliY